MLHRFHVRQPFLLGETVSITGEELHHAARVVRLRQGEEVELFDGDGAAARGTVEELAGAEIRVRLTAAVPARESPLAVTLAMAVIQLEKFELVLQKATELGVRAIVPTESERGEVRPERYKGKGERWQRILFEATKQCGRAMIPTLAAPTPFDELVGRGGTKLLFDADAEPGSLPPSLEAVTLFIGPEGGWSEGELALARVHACTFQRLGPRRLRAETAAIVACTRVQRTDGDL
jgi:16S rRNA (uracil1498-N3)-methyltransferase